MSGTEMALVEPEVEVVAKASRRRFTVAYKRQIVREADGGKTPGAVGALRRREGLYSSHLTVWRAARERGELAGAPKKRGPASQVADPRDSRIEAGLVQPDGRRPGVAARLRCHAAGAEAGKLVYAGDGLRA